MKKAVILIGMESHYMGHLGGNVLEELVESQGRVLKYCEKKNVPLGVFKSNQSFSTNSSLEKKLKKVKHVSLFQKGRFEGYLNSEFKRWVKKNKIQSLGLMGIYTSAGIISFAKESLQFGLNFFTSADLIEDVPVVRKSNSSSVDWFRENGTHFESYKKFSKYLKSK